MASPRRMTARELIAAIEAEAGQLPDGLDSPVILAMCLGGETVAFSREIEADRLHRLSLPVLARRESLVLLKGHQHLDREQGGLWEGRGVAAGADEDLRRMTGSGGS